MIYCYGGSESPEMASVSRSYCDTKLDLASSDDNIPLSFEQQQQNAKTSDYANTTANLLLGYSAYLQ